MPLKKSTAAVAMAPVQQDAPTVAQTEHVAVVKEKVQAEKQTAPMTKDDYWRRREERDIQRDKDMAWSGMAQAALDSVGLVQYNTDNTIEGLVATVVKVTDMLLAERDKRNR